MAETSESLSVRARIRQLVASNLAAAQAEWLEEEVEAGRATEEEASSASVHMWRSSGNHLKHLDLYIAMSSDQGQEGPQGNIGYTTKLMQLLVFVVIRQPEDDQESSDVTHDRWAARIEKELMRDPFWRDQDGTQLATDTRFVETTEPPIAEQQREYIAGVVVEIEYRHPRNDPYAPAN